MEFSKAHLTQIVKALQKGHRESTEPLTGGSISDTRRVQLVYKGQPMSVVEKRRGKGSYRHPIGHEVRAYALAKPFSLPVPPAVRVNQRLVRMLDISAIPATSWSAFDVLIWDVAVGNTDRHSDNIINGWWIDHGFAFRYRTAMADPGMLLVNHQPTIHSTPVQRVLWRTRLAKILKQTIRSDTFRKRYQQWAEATFLSESLWADHAFANPVSEEWANITSYHPQRDGRRAA